MPPGSAQKSVVPSGRLAPRRSPAGGGAVRLTHPHRRVRPPIGWVAPGRSRLCRLKPTMGERCPTTLRTTATAPRPGPPRPPSRTISPRPALPPERAIPGPGGGRRSRDLRPGSGGLEGLLGRAGRGTRLVPHLAHGARVGPPLRPVVRRRHAQRLVQLPRPPRRRRARGQGGLPLGGGAGRHPDHHLRRAARPRSRGSPTCCAGSGSTAATGWRSTCR